MEFIFLLFSTSLPYNWKNNENMNWNREVLVTSCLVSAGRNLQVALNIAVRIFHLNGKNPFEWENSILRFILLTVYLTTPYLKCSWNWDRSINVRICCCSVALYRIYSHKETRKPGLGQDSKREVGAVISQC